MMQVAGDATPSPSDSSQRMRALENHLRAAEQSKSAEEVFACLYAAATLQEELGYPEAEVLATYLRAAEAVPDRAEALHGAARYCRSKGRNEEGYQYASRGAKIAKPAGCPSTEEWIYDFGLLDELAINGYWAGHCRESLNACLQLLGGTALPSAMRERVAQNARFATEKLVAELCAPNAQKQPTGSKRYIRLKEFEPGLECLNTPNPAYLAERDSSLAREAYRLSADANGFIQPEPSFDGAAKTVVVIGDSVVESLFSQPENRFCSRLQNILRSDYGMDVTVLNGGYSGATTLHSFNVILNKLVPLKPAAIILMTGIVDVDVAYLRDSFWTSDHFLEPIVSPAQNNTTRDQQKLDDADFSDRARLLGLCADACARFEIPLYFATVPHRQAFSGEYVEKSFKTLADFSSQVVIRRAMNEVTRKVAAAQRVPLLDLEERLRERNDIFFDMFHLNDRGGEAVARAIADCGLADLMNDAPLPIPSATTSAIASGRPVSNRELDEVLEVHLINLDRSTDRLARFRERNAHLSRVIRVAAVDGLTLDRQAAIDAGQITADLSYSNGTVGCALSHINLWKKAVDNNRIVTIFEDDVVASLTFEANVRRILSNVDRDWDIIFWGYIFNPLFIWAKFNTMKANLRFYDCNTSNDDGRFHGPLNATALQLAHCFGTQAYSLSPSGAQALLNTCLPLRNRKVGFPGTGIVNEDSGIDVAMNLVYPDMEGFICVPPIAIQDDGLGSERLNMG